MLPRSHPLGDVSSSFLLNEPQPWTPQLSSSRSLELRVVWNSALKVGIGCEDDLL